METSFSIEKKIVNLESLHSLMGDYATRNKSYIICHGVFDVVHPGHIRHLEYAKKQADFLIVSITSDEFINKGVYRPHVSEEIRALSLAHLQIVDFVIINRAETPDNLLEYLKPNFFAKGFEYVSNGLNPATTSEQDIVKSYGGKIIFTPGDVVYSSSSLIETNEPNLMREKISLVLKKNQMNKQDLYSILNNFSGKKVLVVGDTIVDTIIESLPYGNSHKTPTLSVLKNGEQDYIGGAAIVAQHLKSTGAEVEFYTSLGKDRLGEWVDDELLKTGIKVNSFFEPKRGTTRKSVINCKGYRLLKIDEVDNRPLLSETISEISNRLSSSNADICIFSDFRHGIFNRNSISKLTQSIAHIPTKVADSQVSSRWGNITDFKNFDLITPNEKEARFSLGDQDSTIHRLALDLLEETRANNVIIKLGERGLLGCKYENQSPNFVGMNSLASKVVDSVGSGDALLAYSSLALHVSNNLGISALIGSIAASKSCSYDGNKPIEVKDIREELDRIISDREYQQS
jgi:rfaE bifunctional protein kinase chain/domain/rfaE bifunctional protein nucleotidyltransferase chain/domain